VLDELGGAFQVAGVVGDLSHRMQVEQVDRVPLNVGEVDPAALVQHMVGNLLPHAEHAASTRMAPSSCQPAVATTVVSNVRLVGEPAVDDRVDLEPFLSDEIVGIARPGSLPMRNGKVNAGTLAAQTLLLRAAGSSTRRVAERALRAAKGRAESGLGARLRRGDQEGRARGPRGRFPLALRRRRGRWSGASSRASASPADRRSSGISMLPVSPAASPSPSERGLVTTLTRCCSQERRLHRCVHPVARYH
jgi:hypothetical protein